MVLDLLLPLPGSIASVPVFMSWGSTDSQASIRSVAGNLHISPLSLLEVDEKTQVLLLSVTTSVIIYNPRGAKGQRVGFHRQG